jgi:hypothetical protein
MRDTAWIVPSPFGRVAGGVWNSAETAPFPFGRGKVGMRVEIRQKDQTTVAKAEYEVRARVRSTRGIQTLTLPSPLKGEGTTWSAVKMEYLTTKINCRSFLAFLAPWR